jgi:hypothetical protein
MKARKYNSCMGLFIDKLWPIVNAKISFDNNDVEAKEEKASKLNR